MIPQAIVRRAEATFNRIAKRDARLAKSGRRFQDAGTKWQSLRPEEVRDRAGRNLLLGSDEQHGQPNRGPGCRPGLHGEPLPSLGRYCRRRCLADRQRPCCGPAVEASRREGSRPELGRSAHARSHRPEARTRSTSPPVRATAARPAARPAPVIYKSTDGGEHWKKLADACVSNATYPCVNPGKDSFLGRGINGLVIDPRNGDHIFVGSALAVRGLSHTIGNPRRHDSPRARRERARPLRVVRRRRDVHRGLERQHCRRLRRHRRRSRSAQPGRRLRVRVRRGCVAARRRSGRPRRSRRSSRRSLPGGGHDRTMFALTVKNGTDADLPDGRHGQRRRHRRAASRRTSGAPTTRNQPAAALLASQGRGGDASRIRRRRVPGDLQRLAEADLEVDGEPVLRDRRLLLGAVLVRRGRLHAGGLAGHRVRDRRLPVRRAAVQHEGRRLR